MTKQRKEIFKHLKSVGTHPNAEMVYKAVKKELTKITLATVYRNLNLLAKNRDITRHEIGGEYRYDAEMEYHQHCICTNCNKIIDTYNKEVSDFAMDKLKSSGFIPDHVQISYFGLCAMCKAS